MALSTFPHLDGLARAVLACAHTIDATLTTRGNRRLLHSKIYCSAGARLGGDHNEQPTRRAEVDDMRPFLSDCTSPRFAPHIAQASIAVGLTILVANIAFPALPVATGFALVALGASITVVSRFATSTVIMSSLLVYSCLYYVFVGAICDAAMHTSASALSVVQITDLGLSAGIMAFTLRVCLVAITGDRGDPTQ